MPEHIGLLLEDPQIHFKSCSDIHNLLSVLAEKNYTAFSGAGITKDQTKYVRMLEEGKGNLGMGFKLETPTSPLVQDLLSYFRSQEFHSCIRNKFSIIRETKMYSDIRKYLSRYEISPHPDMREKAMTYLLNINSPKALGFDIHTKVMAFKREYNYKYLEWEKNASVQREWVPWEWCETYKTIKENNSIVLFSPNNRTLHGVKLDYPHLDFQRTQVYGNLIYT